MANTDFGPVQVEVTILAKHITNVRAIQYPSGGHSTDVNANAIPQLQAQAIAAQSASLDGVSGATYTTQGFEASLQSALDAAHFAA